MRAKKNLIIFDFDGIIVENCHKRNIMVEEWGLWKIAKLYLDDFDGKEKKVIIKKIREIGIRTLDSLTLKKDAVPFINFVRCSGCKTAVLSNNSSVVIRAFLGRQGLINKFDMIVGAEDVRRMKPYSEGLAKIMNAFGASRRETLYIGDSIFDLIAGTAMWIDTVQSIGEAKKFLGVKNEKIYNRRT